MTDAEFARSLDWLHAWNMGVAHVEVYTAEIRNGFMRTLAEIQGEPEASDAAHIRPTGKVS